ncbi:hypothetical protein V1289_009484 [Bradyrhizobium sp. AZCC 2289]
MRIIALLFAFVLTGCAGDRLRAEAKPTAVALSAPPMAATFENHEGKGVQIVGEARPARWRLATN